MELWSEKEKKLGRMAIKATSASEGSLLAQYSMTRLCISERNPGPLTPALFRWERGTESLSCRERGFVQKYTAARRVVVVDSGRRLIDAAVGRVDVVVDCENVRPAVGPTERG